MERFNNYLNGLIELVLLGIIYLIALPFRILYNLSHRLVSR
jgi:hypothetical protein